MSTEPRSDPKRLERALEQSMDGICMADMDGNVTYVNRAWLRMHGYEAGEAGEVIGRPLQAFHTSAQYENELEPFMCRLKEAGSHEGELGQMRRDGSTFRSWLTATVILDEAGRPIGCVGSARDITERQQAEEALRESEEQYRIVAETATDGIVTIDEQSVIVYANPVAQRIFGYTPLELIGRPLTDLMPESSRARHLEALRQYVDSGVRRAPWSGMEMHGLHRDGREVPLEVSFGEHVQGERHLFTGILRDIGGRKRVERFHDGQYRVLALLGTGAALEDVLEALARTMEVICTGTLASVRVLAADGRGLRLAAAPGLPPEYRQALASIPVGERHTSCGAAAHRGERVIVGDVASDPIWEAYTATALRHGVRACWSQPIVCAGGDVLGTFAMHYPEPRRPGTADIKMIEAAAHLAAAAIQLHRQRQFVEDELRHAKDTLVRSTRLAAIGQVAASIAHELRNPLGAIRNAVYFLRRRAGDGKGKEKEIEHLGIIEQEVHAADRIIGNLLEMSRAKEPARREVELAEVARAAFDRIRRPSDVRLDLDHVPEGFSVFADPGQLRQVLANLINNAVQAMGAKGRIAVRAEREEPDDVIIVEDDGPGVPPEIHENLFEPLFTTRAKGTGLGLAICRQIVERHGGKIRFVDGGSGAVFRIRLPGAAARGSAA